LVAETDEPIKKIACELGVAAKTLRDWRATASGVARAFGRSLPRVCAPARSAATRGIAPTLNRSTTGSGCTRDGATKPQSPLNSDRQAVA
jgi:transposase-like protein